MKRPLDASGRIVLDSQAISSKLQDLAQAIQKEFSSSPELALVGIQTRGAHMARRLALVLEKLRGKKVAVGILDITLYRDDVNGAAEQPEVKETDLPFAIDNLPLVLVDDVLFTGRTVRSAMNALIDYGRPRCIRLAVLIDRGLRELPIGADYAGLSLPTEAGDIVDVNFQEVDGEDCVRVRPRAKADS